MKLYRHEEDTWTYSNPRYTAKRYRRVTYVASASDKDHDYCAHASTMEEAVAELKRIMELPWNNTQLVIS